MNYKTHIIGLTGYASAGKDTVAKLLGEHCGFRVVAFAGALRAEVAAGFGIDMHSMTHPVAKNLATSALTMRKAPIAFLAAVALAVPGVPRNDDGMPTPEWLDRPRSPRQIMQWWGTEYRRASEPNYWTSLLTQRIVDMSRNGLSRFAITDVRFLNEANSVRAMGGTLWQVRRTGIDASTTKEGQHASVTDGREFDPDTVIGNTHDLRHLQEVVLGEFLALETGIAGTTVGVPA